MLFVFCFLLFKKKFFIFSVAFLNLFLHIRPNTLNTLGILLDKSVTLGRYTALFDYHLIIDFVNTLKRC